MRVILLVVSFYFLGCAGPKYIATFESGSTLDFSKGKWILNQTQSNSRLFDTRLHRVVHEEFREILGDSLVELHSLRTSLLLPPEIGFHLDGKELRSLGKDSGCHFLINVTGTVVTNNAGSINVPLNDPGYYATNESWVQIRIYDLRTGLEISSARMDTKLVNEGSHFDDPDRFPTLNMSAQTAMLKAGRKLVRKYRKNGAHAGK